MDDTLLSLELVLLTNARRETLGGREYVVADAVILREQVLNGSDGPLFYPLNEINQDVGVWNGYPLTAGHPFVLHNGEKVNVSARVAKVAHEFQIGTLYNDRMVGNERLVEAWFDVQNANRIDPKIIPAVLANQAINISTGIFTKKRQAIQNANHNGTGYSHSVFNIRPDHLAVLMNERGACSVKDGCGINVRTTTNEDQAMKCPKCGKAMTDGKCECGYKTPTANAQATISWLTTNCDCWKGKDVVLANFDEAELTAIKTNTEGARGLVLVTNSLKEVGLPTDKPLTVEMIQNHFKMQTDTAVKKAVEDAKKTTTNTEGNKVEITQEMLTNALKGMKETDVLVLFPTLNEAVKTARDVVNEKRYEVMRKLVANVSDPKEKERKLLLLRDKPLPVLNEMLEFAVVNAPDKPQGDDKTFLANFFGQAGGPSDHTGQGAQTVNKGEILPTSPEFSFDD